MEENTSSPNTPSSNLVIDYRITKKGEAIIPKAIKQWIKKEIHKYCRQLGLTRKDFPDIITYSAHEMNKLYGYKPSYKKTFFHKKAGTCNFEDSAICINVPKYNKGESVNSLRRIIVHEVVHHRFPGLNHYNPATERMFNVIVNQVLNEGKTYRDLVCGKKTRLIIKQKNKPLLTRKNGKTSYQYIYARTAALKSKIVNIHYKLEFSVETYRRKNGRREYVILKAYPQSHPYAYDFMYFPHKRTAKSRPIHEFIEYLLPHVKEKIIWRVHNGDKSINITLEYDESKEEEYDQMIKQKQKELMK